MKKNRSLSVCNKHKFNLVLVVLFISLLFSANLNAQVGTQPIIGHWDITVDMGNNQTASSWLEVKLSGNKTFVGHYVSVEGSARPVSMVNVEGQKITFSIPPQWEFGAKNLVFEGMLENDKLAGTITFPNGKQNKFTGERAPLMIREKPPVWGEPVKIFNGQNLDGWVTQKPANQWIVENGVLKSPKSGSNLLTTQKFQDFKLHIEFRYPEGSNSGIFLRGRYELQIIDSRGQEPSSVLFGGIYGFLTPTEDVAKAPDEWQTYDITLVGRRLTVEANGKTIICDQTIPGITGEALDSREAEPGPILLQGNHGAIEFRNIVLTPAK
ncbi:MAG: DUF1080 domain-containing protein [Bacteroidales bacterium]|nr:DUF1080 domain-containing protein [Bacteroidales bacterium]